MSIKTITTLLTHEPQIDTQLVAAAGVARALDAHLHAIALGIGLDAPAMLQDAFSAVPVTIGFEESVAKADALGEAASALLTNEDLRWNIETVAMPAVHRVAEIVRHTRFSDLVIHQRPTGTDHADETDMLAETILFDADCPLLLLPEQTTVSAPPRKIMVAWDESATSLRAARQALPLLKAASAVHVVLVDPPKDAPDRSDPGGAFAHFLSRQGITCEVAVCNRTDNSIAATLQRRAKELGCDMMVMGAYGHSRLRQAIFGGTTRDILAGAALPVFMAH